MSQRVSSPGIFPQNFTTLGRRSSLRWLERLENQESSSPEDASRTGISSNGLSADYWTPAFNRIGINACRPMTAELPLAKSLPQLGSLWQRRSLQESKSDELGLWRNRRDVPGSRNAGREDPGRWRAEKCFSRLGSHRGNWGLDSPLRWRGDCHGREEDKNGEKLCVWRFRESSLKLSMTRRDSGWARPILAAS